MVRIKHILVTNMKGNGYNFHFQNLTHSKQVNCSISYSYCGKWHLNISYPFPQLMYLISLIKLHRKLILYYVRHDLISLDEATQGDISMYLYLSISISVSISIYVSIYLSIYVYVYICLSMYPFIYLYLTLEQHRFELHGFT